MACVRISEIEEVFEILAWRGNSDGFESRPVLLNFHFFDHVEIFQFFDSKMTISAKIRRKMKSVPSTLDVSEIS